MPTNPNTPPSDLPAPLAPAPVAPRLKAAVYDWMLLFWLVGIFASPLEANGIDQKGVAALFLAVAYFYFAGFESSRWMATPFKRMQHLRVCDMQGKRISFYRASVRFSGKICILLSAGLGLLPMLRGKRRRALDDMFAFTCVFGGDIAPLELATARPGTRWHARPGVYLLLLWIALTVGFRINLGKQTDLSGAPTPADFHVIAAVGPQDQREVKWLSLNELGSMGYIDENLSLALPPGPGQVLHEGGWDDLHYEVHALPDGSQRVEALLTKEWANERVVYRLENGKVLAEQYALIYPGAWAIALFGSTPLVFTLYFVWSLLMWIGKATKKSADPAQR